MNCVRLLAAALLVAGVATAEDKKADDKAAKEEMKKLEGTWKASSAEMAGKEFKPKDLGMEKASIKGGKITFTNKDKVLMSLELIVAPGRKPKQMDWVKDKKQTVPCIYELKGDELKICFPLVPGKGEKVKVQLKRPEDFETKDKPVGLIVLKREKS